MGFAYTKSTNTMVITDGTSGAPVTNHDAYVADQAGTVTLLAAWSPISSTKALTYQLTPAQAKGLKIDFTVAAKTAEADYIFITGTDIDGAAQTESLDVSAGNGTYTTTKWFATITNIDCTDNAAGGGTLWADGTVAVVQNQWGVVWEHRLNTSYTYDCIVAYGDGATATYFAAESEAIIYNKAVSWTANAVARYGRWISTPATYYISNNSSHGCYIKFAEVHGDITSYYAYGQLLIYGSVVNCAKDGSTHRIILRSQTGGSIDIRNSIVNGHRGVYCYTVNDVIYRGIFQDAYYGVMVQNVPLAEFEFSCYRVASYYDVTVSNVDVVSVLSYNPDKTLSIENPITHISTVQIDQTTSQIIEQYTCNIHIADSDGNDLENVTVTCTDKNADTVWSVVTDANGDIAEQVINYKKWAGTSETLTEYSPHTFEFTHADYPDFVMNNITVNKPIDWSIEMGISTAQITAACSESTPSVTVSDKTGFSLSSAGILAIWHTLLENITTPLTIGKKIKDWVLGTDNKSLISTDAQDLSATLDVNAKLLNDEVPNNLAADDIDIPAETNNNINHDSTFITVHDE